MRVPSDIPARVMRRTSVSSVAALRSALPIPKSSTTARPWQNMSFRVLSSMAMGRSRFMRVRSDSPSSSGIV